MNTVLILLAARFRRDRLQLLLWLLGFAALAAVGHSAVEAEYGTAKAREGVITLLMQTPTVLVLRGTPQGVQSDAFQFMLLFAFIAVLIGLMCTFLAVRHTRGDEEKGRAELVESTPAGRMAPLYATAIEGTIAAVVVGAVNAGGFIAYGARFGEALLAGAAVAGVGIAFLGIGLVCAQLMRTSRGANGLAAALVAIAYFVRGIGDAAGTIDVDGAGAPTLTMTPSWISWLSPIGWGQRTNPFSDPTWWPVLLLVGLGVLAFGVAVALRAARDIDASLIPERRGRRAARRTLSGTLAITARSLRNPTIGWVVSGLLFGLLVGSLGDTLASAEAPAEVKDNLGNIVGGLAGPGATGQLIDLFVVAMFSVMGALAAICAVQAVSRARQDEAGGIAETVLATRTSRVRWFIAYLLVGLISVVLVLAAGVLGALVGAAGSADAGERAETIALAGLAQLPATVLLLGVVAFAFAVVPRWSIGLGWGILLLAIFIGQFGGLVGLPDWARDISPFSHTPIVTASDPDWTGAWVMLGIGVVVAAASVLLVRRRDLALGG